MPKELVRISSDILWCNAVIRPCPSGFETVLHFFVRGESFSIAFNSLPDPNFFEALREIRCVSVVEYGSAERGWVEEGRYVVFVNDDDDYDKCRALGDYVRWGPTSRT